MLIPATGERGRERDHSSPLSSLSLSRSLTHQIQREINISAVCCCCCICKIIHFIYSSFVCGFMFIFFSACRSRSLFCCCLTFFNADFKITHSWFYSTPRYLTSHTSDCPQLVHTVNVTPTPIFPHTHTYPFSYLST